MPEEADRFRARARQCRDLSKLARNDYSRNTLAQMAVELEEEAELIEGHGPRKDDRNASPQ